MLFGRSSVCAEKQVKQEFCKLEPSASNVIFVRGWERCSVALPSLNKSLFKAVSKTKAYLLRLQISLQGTTRMTKNANMKLEFTARIGFLKLRWLNVCVYTPPNCYSTENVFIHHCTWNSFNICSVCEKRSYYNVGHKIKYSYIFCVILLPHA